MQNRDDILTLQEILPYFSMELMRSKNLLKPTATLNGKTIMNVIADHIVAHSE